MALIINKQNLKTVTVGKGNSMLYLKEDHFFENQKPLTVMPKQNKNEAKSY